MKTHSSSSPSSSKSTRRYEKPRPDFPLSIHQGQGYWCKKVKGHVYYFGRIEDDPQGNAALEEWLRVKDDPDLLAGGEPRAAAETVTVKELVNRFLVLKEGLRDNGELSPRTFQGYHATCGTIISVFGRQRTVLGLTPDDFRKLRTKLAAKRGVVALRNEMQRVRSVFKFAYDDGLIPAPVKFGQSFVKPKLDAVRREREAHRNEHGDRMFEAAEIRLMLDHLNGKDVKPPRREDETREDNVVKGKANPGLKAMLLLAANCGFGQTDLSNLPLRAIDFSANIVDFARVKTAVPRKIPIWPETVAAIRDWIAVRPKAKNPEDESLLFLTCRGQRWVKLNKTGSPSDAIGQEFCKVVAKLGMKRSRVSFYGLRHGFETIAGETADQVAVDAIMGHVPQGMSAHYRERIGNDRLLRVVNHVRSWLFGEPQPETAGQPESENSTNSINDRKADGNLPDTQSPSLRLFVG